MRGIVPRVDSKDFTGALAVAGLCFSAVVAVGYGTFVPPKTSCYAQYVYEWSDYLREITILLMMAAAIVIFLIFSVHNMRSTKVAWLNVTLFLLSCLILILFFTLYFYTYGIVLTEYGARTLDRPAATVASEFIDYFYFAVANSIYMATPEFEPCGALRGGVVLQRMASLVVAFCASLIGARIASGMTSSS